MTLSPDNLHRTLLFAKFGINNPESALLGAVASGIRELPTRIPGLSGDGYYGLGVTEPEFRLALASCLDKRWLQLVDESVLSDICHELQERCLGPIYQLPGIGTVDFTRDGANLWRAVCKEWQAHCDEDRTRDKSPAFAYTDVVHSKKSLYFLSEALARAEIEEIKKIDDGVVTLTPPIPIGPWCVQWWRRFSVGYRIDVEEKWQCQGRGGGSYAFWSLQRPRQWAFDLERLHSILKARDIPLGQWIILSAMDDEGATSISANRLYHSAGQGAKKTYGVSLSERECQNIFQQCLNAGLLRVVDKEARAEIQSWLQIGPSIKPLYEQGGIMLKTVDFTPNGADLYQLIASEYFGQKWSEGIKVAKENYRKEHRYCETEEGIMAAMKAYVDGHEAVIRSEIVPIGPWCVYWWNRLPGGFKLEVEIGTR